LRRVAWADADIVVLHAHPYSVIPVAAFGVAGGPPVLLLNHLSQQFWIGGSIADLVICLRPSAVDWARQYRGIDRTFMLPIPISARDTERSQNSPGSPGQSLRARLGIPRDAIVFLTVGNAYKYLALPHLDFLEAAKMIVQRLPEAHLIAIGPRSDDARWRKARESAGDRLHVPGPTSDLSEYHAAADIYLEGFPIGSPTALFEALEQDVACVRAPETVPPPFAADGIALTALDQPKDVAAFVDRAVDLARDDSARIRLGAMLGEETRANHSEAGWRRHYLELLTHLPEEHRIYPDQHIHTLGSNALYLATAVSIAHHRRGTFTYTHAAATKSNLNPKLDSLLTRRVLFHGAVSDLRPLLYLLKRSLSLGHRGAPT
jgi:glycosyltransferase involved in cell wall biosynthesis